MAADLAIIDTGEKPCSHPGVAKIFDDLRRPRLFPVQPRPKILVETLRFVQRGALSLPLEHRTSHATALKNMHGKTREVLASP